MTEIRQNATMIRGEQALSKEKRLQVQRNAPHYRVESDDIYLLTGPYKDNWVKTLWQQSSQGRDYIFQYVYSVKDPSIQRIVRQCFCL